VFAGNFHITECYYGNQMQEQNISITNKQRSCFNTTSQTTFKEQQTGLLLLINNLMQNFMYVYMCIATTCFLIVNPNASMQIYIFCFDYDCYKNMYTLGHEQMSEHSNICLFM